MLTRTYTQHKKRGFTSVELVVVLAIFGTLSSITLFKFSDFSSSVSLNNLAHDIALYAKRAQTEASSGRRISGTYGFTEGVAPSFGVFFNATTGDRFVYFKDIGSVPNGRYSNTAAERIEEVIIERADRIIGLWVEDSGYKRVSDLHVTFTRPDLEATFKTSTGGVSATPSRGFIVITGSSGKVKTIVIHRIGQIEVVDGVPAGISL